MPDLVYQKWSLVQARGIVRRELADPSGRWWSDSFLNQAIGWWQDDVQQEMELVWGTADVVTTTSTLTLGTIFPAIHRLDAVYYNNYRLPGRIIQNLEDMLRDWRSVTGAPRAVIQNDSRTLTIWPPLTTQGTVTLEYPQSLVLNTASDASLLSLPAWTQYTLRPYCCYRAYARPGPTNDLRRAARYRKEYERKMQWCRVTYANFLPERFRLLKLAAKYEIDILRLPESITVTAPGVTMATFNSYDTFTTSLSGLVNGTNTVFTLPVTPTSMQVFRNGNLQLGGGFDYTWNGVLTITFVTPPVVGDLIIAWVYRA